MPCGYSVTTIMGPALPPFGQTTLRLHDINDAGLAVGHYFLISSARVQCTWTAEEGVKAIPVGASGILDAESVKVNNNNWILVNAQTNRGKRGFVLIPNASGSWDWVQMLPPVEGGVDTWVFDINDKNQVVGRQSAGVGNYPHGGYMWSIETGRVDIAIEGWNATSCVAINDAGTIAGDVSQSVQASGAASTRAFVLHEGAVTIVEPRGPYATSACGAINAAGILAGGFANATGLVGVGFTLDGSRDELVVIPPPQEASRWMPRDINGTGVMCGAMILSSNNQLRACVADGSGVLNLTQYAPPGVSYLSDAPSIRDDGTMVIKCISFCSVLLWPVDASVGDVNCDGTVGPKDVAAVINAWGAKDSAADTNADGVVDGADLGVVLANWTQG